jgi:hypothetical protein
MSRKSITVTLPPGLAGLPPDSTGFAPDDWVLAAAHPAPDNRRVLIDLTARRSWFELAQLVWVFPYLATWHWFLQTTTALPRRREH